MTTTIKNKRIDEIGMAKGLGILMVFLKHTFEFTGISNYAPSVYNVLSTFFEVWIIMFIVLSGYTYKPKETLKEDIRKKVKTYMIPYLYGCMICTIFFIIADLIIGKMDKVNFIQCVVSNFLGAADKNFFNLTSNHNPLSYSLIPYWYFAEIFVSFVLMILIYRPIRNKSTSIKSFVAVILLGIGIVFDVLDLQGTVENTFSAVFSYFFVLPNIFSFAGILLIGVVLQEIHLLDIDSYSKQLSVSLAIISTIIWLVAAFNYNNVYGLQCGKWGQYGAFSIIITSVCGIAFTYLVIFIFHYAKKLYLLKSIFSYLGKNTLYILLSHYLICEIFSFLYNKRYEIYNTGFPSTAFSLPIAIMIISSTAIVMICTLEIKNYIYTYSIPKDTSVQLLTEQ